MGIVSAAVLFAGSVYFMTASKSPAEDYSSQVIALMKHLSQSAKLESGKELCSLLEAATGDFHDFKKAFDKLKVPALNEQNLCGQKYESTAVGHLEKLLVDAGFSVAEHATTPMTQKKEFQVTIGSSGIEAVEDGRVIAILGANPWDQLQVFLRTAANKSWINGISRQVIDDQIVNSTNQLLIVYQYKQANKVKFDN